MRKKNLEISGPIDENLKLVRDQDGTDTPLELISISNFLCNGGNAL